MTGGAQLNIKVQSANAQLNAAKFYRLQPVIGFEVWIWVPSAIRHQTPLNVAWQKRIDSEWHSDSKYRGWIANARPVFIDQIRKQDRGWQLCAWKFPSGCWCVYQQQSCEQLGGLGHHQCESAPLEGLAGGTWDLTTTNWINIGSGLPTTYGQGNVVAFNDSALGTTTVNLVGTLSPNGVTVNNNTLLYAFAGTGKISGSAGLAKQGASTLTITNTGGNDYTGPTIISGGVVSVTSLANGGSPSAIGKSSANATNLVLAGGNLTYGGPATSIDRGYSTTAAGSSITTVSNLTLTGIANATAFGGLTKIGNAQLAYKTVGNNVLSGSSSTGYKVQAGSVLFDGTAGAQTNLVSNNLSAAGVTANASIILTNTTVTTTGNMDLGIDSGTTGTLLINNGNATLNVGSWFTFSRILRDSVWHLHAERRHALNVPNGRLFLCSAPGTTCTFNINGGVLNKSGRLFRRRQRRLERSRRAHRRGQSGERHR